MDMNRKSGFIAIASLIIGFSLGTSLQGVASAEESATVSIPQGDFLKVCIDKKSGEMRAANKCKTNEKPYSLGGPGPRGPQGFK